VQRLDSGSSYESCVCPGNARTWGVAFHHSMDDRSARHKTILAAEVGDRVFSLLDGQEATARLFDSTTRAFVQSCGLWRRCGYVVRAPGHRHRLAAYRSS
jgi:hypothetical protein